MLLLAADFFFFFFIFFFFKKSFWNTTRMSNCLDLDQLSIGPDLGPNCLQRYAGLCMH